MGSVVNPKATKGIIRRLWGHPSRDFFENYLYREDYIIANPEGQAVYLPGKLSGLVGNWLPEYFLKKGMYHYSLKRPWKAPPRNRAATQLGVFPRDPSL